MTIPNSANGGIHTANFRVLRLANCPAVLVECGYLSNRSEGNQARDSEYRELLADRIAEAIVEQRYGAGVYQPPPQIAAQARNLPAAAPASRQLARDRVRQRILKFLSAFFGTDSGEEN